MAITWFLITANFKEIKMTKDEYIDHEVRLRMLERLYEKLDIKMNAIITIAITGLLLPIILKYFEV